MKDPYQVLRQKENAISEIRQQVEALRAVIPLLADSADEGRQTSERNPSAPATETRMWGSGKNGRDDKVAGESH
jgi:hypothetical protein